VPVELKIEKKSKLTRVNQFQIGDREINREYNGEIPVPFASFPVEEITKYWGSKFAVPL